MIGKERLPRHIAIIMDGNGRWARKRGFPRAAGHRQGAKVVKRIVEECRSLGIEVLTLYAFSTENWLRPQKEINLLMGILRRFLKEEERDLNAKNIRFITIGRTDRLSPATRGALAKIKQSTGKNTGLKLNLALNYGARQEIIEATRRIADDFKSGRLKRQEINEKVFSSYLHTSGLPDPDLIIRTSGECRLSNFLLWQGSYSELCFIPKLWPDFKKSDLHQAIEEYQRRERRFGDIKRR